MRILYITLLWSGLDDILCRGLQSAQGMPAFIEPLRRLIKKGHHIDIVIVDAPVRQMNIGPEWLNNARIFWVNNRSFLKLLPLLAIIRRGKYDFIYGQGGAAGWANIAALLTRTACGVRFYGTFLSKHLHESRWRMFRASPLEVVTHNLPKKFMIITNDGTKGDQVNHYCCLFKNLYEFKFWLNGVEITTGNTNNDSDAKQIVSKAGLNPGLPFLFYPGRYSKWKHQDYAIEILYKLKQNGYNSIQLFCCGHIYDDAFYAFLIEQIKKYELDDRVALSGPLSKCDLYSLFQSSLATLSLYDFSNLGNVVIEAAIAGAIIITRNDGSTDLLIENNKNGFLINTLEEGVHSILSLLENPAKKEELSSLIRQSAFSIFETWDERSEKEIRLIEETMVGNVRLP